MKKSRAGPVQEFVSEQASQDTIPCVPARGSHPTLLK